MDTAVDADFEAQGFEHGTAERTQPDMLEDVFARVPLHSRFLPRSSFLEGETLARCTVVGLPAPRRCEHWSLAAYQSFGCQRVLPLCLRLLFLRPMFRNGSLCLHRRERATFLDALRLFVGTGLQRHAAHFESLSSVAALIVRGRLVIDSLPSAAQSWSRWGA